MAEEREDEELVLDMGVRTVQIPLRNKQGEVEKWSMVELTVSERDNYSQSVIRATRNKDKADYRGLQADLVVLVLRDPTGTPPKKETVLSWGSKTGQALYDKAAKLCGLDGEKSKDEMEESAKNE